MQDFYVKVGDRVSFAKTVGETDIYLFAGITGDFSVNHVNEQYMAGSKYGRRIAHGALIVGYMSTCSTLMIDQCQGTARDETPVSLGYDKVRFLGPVFIGDTVTLTYTIAEIDAQKRQSLADIRAVNQNGDIVAVARHILRWVKDASLGYPCGSRARSASSPAAGPASAGRARCCLPKKARGSPLPTSGRRAPRPSPPKLPARAPRRSRSRWTSPTPPRSSA